jgi:hypothetical protein
MPWRAHIRGVSWRLGVALSLAVALIAPVRCVARCQGDCNADGAVSSDDLLQDMLLGLGMTTTGSCASVDVNRNGIITVDELLGAVDAAVEGCPMNQPPVVPASPVYRTYLGFPMHVGFGATDPDGDALHYAASSLPSGAQLDATTGILDWTPGASQVGPFHIDFTVTDDGDPPQSTDSMLAVAVSPPDSCVQATCDPASGCVANLLPLTQPCCIEQPSVRTAEPLASCPEARVLHIGHNTNGGVGRVQDCDLFPVFNFGQTSAQVRLNIEARCLNFGALVTVHARMVANLVLHRVIFDSAKPVTLRLDNDGYARALAINFPVNGPGPFFAFEGADAILSVDITDIDGTVVSQELRVTMTFQPVADLPNLPDQ